MQNTSQITMFGAIVNMIIAVIYNVWFTGRSAVLLLVAGLHHDNNDAVPMRRGTQHAIMHDNNDAVPMRRGTQHAITHDNNTDAVAMVCGTQDANIVHLWAVCSGKPRQNTSIEDLSALNRTQLG